MLYKCILLRICKNVSFVPQTQFNGSSLFLMNWVLEAVLLQIWSSRRICFPNSLSVGIVSPFIYLAWGPIVNKRDLGIVFCPFRKSMFVNLVFKNKNGTVGLTTQDLRSFFTWRHFAVFWHYALTFVVLRMPDVPFLVGVRCVRRLASSQWMGAKQAESMVNIHSSWIPFPFPGLGVCPSLAPSPPTEASFVSATQFPLAA